MKRPRLSLSAKISTVFVSALVALLASAPAAMATSVANCITGNDPIGIIWGIGPGNETCYENSGQIGFTGGLHNVQTIFAGRWSGSVTIENSSGDWVLFFSPQQTLHLDGATLYTLHVN